MSQRLEDRADVTREQAVSWRAADGRVRSFFENYVAETWVTIGMSAYAIQLTAQDEARVSQPKGKKYHESRSKLLETLPNLRVLDKVLLDGAIWLFKSWEFVKPWLDSLTRTERIKLCLPDVIRRKWEASQNPTEKKRRQTGRQGALEKVSKALEDKIEEVDRLKAALAKAEEERDAVRQAIKSELSEIIEDVDPIDDPPELIRKVLREKVKQPKFIEFVIHIIRLAWPSRERQRTTATQHPLLM